MSADDDGDAGMLDLLVVGAGPHALSLLTRVLEDDPDLSGDFFIGLGSRPKSIVETKEKCFPKGPAALRQRERAARIMQRVAVVDPAGRWLARWDAQFEGLRIPHLRSPYDLHPAPWDSFALQGFVEAQGLDEELTNLDFIGNDSEGGAYKQGSFRTAQAPLFMRFCAHVCERYALEDAVTQGVVRRVEPLRGADGAVESFNVHVWCEQAAGGAGGGEGGGGGAGAARIFRARRVVLALGTTRLRRLPCWAEGLVPAPSAETGEAPAPPHQPDHPPSALVHAWDLLDGRGGAFRGGATAWGGSERGAATVAQPGIDVPVTAASVGAEVARSHAAFEALFGRTLSASRNAKFLAAVAKAAAAAVAAGGGGAGRKAVQLQRAVIAGFRKALELPRVALLVAGGAADAGPAAEGCECGSSCAGAAEAALGREWRAFARSVEHSLAPSAAAFARQFEAAAEGGRGSAPPPAPAPAAAAAAAAAATAAAATGPLAGERVLVVGGGLTSAHLLRTALDGGAAHVTLCSRAALREKQFDLTLEWVGWRHRPGTLARFLAEQSMEARLAALQSARGGGSVTPEGMQHLRAELAAGRATLLEQAEVASAEWCEEEQPRNAAAAAAPPRCSWRVDFDRDVAGELGAATRADGGGDPCAGRFDRIWLATGSVLDVASDPILAPLLASVASPHAGCGHAHADGGAGAGEAEAGEGAVRVVGGLPVLHPSLALRRGVPCFVMGGYAALQLGPDALNLAGGRAGACRIASVIRGAVRAAAGVDDVPSAGIAAEEARRIAACERLRVRYNRKSGYVGVSVCDELAGAAAAAAVEQQQQRQRQHQHQQRQPAQSDGALLATAAPTEAACGGDDAGGFKCKPGKKERQHARKRANAVRLAKRYVSGCEHDCAHAPRPGTNTMEKQAAAAVQDAARAKSDAALAATSDTTPS